MSNSKLGELLFMDTAHCDIVFVVGTEEIPGHRNAFAASCPYFDKLLYSDFKESKSVKVEITETSAKIFKEVKRFIYLGSLEIAEWKIEDLLELLAVAHEYQYKVLYDEVMNALEKQPLDFNLWSLVNSAAAIYESNSLRAKCVSFAEAEVDNFLSLKNLEKVTQEFICAMFDTPKIRTVNQDELLTSLLQWKKTHQSAQIKSVYEKICWTKVSHNKTAAFAKLFFLNLKNEDEVLFYNQVLDAIQVESHWIVRLDNVVLCMKKRVGFTLEKCDCNIYLYYYKQGIEFYFQKNGSYKDIPVERIEFELSNQYRIQKVVGWRMKSLDKEMDYKILNESNIWCKYSATYPGKEPLYLFYIYSGDFAEAPEEITLRSLVIY